MAYEFQAVDIFIFDYHGVIKPFIMRNAIRPEFQFLINPVDYNQQYQSGQVVQTTNLKIQPLKWRSLEYHHFWRYYKNCHFEGESPDFWRLQMPFVCYENQQQSSIKLRTGSPNFAGTVRAFVFLTGIGWSTNLEIRLRGRIKPEELREFIKGLPKISNSVFEVNGNRKNLTKIFEYFSEFLKKEVYQPISTAYLTIPRYHIINLSQFSGDIAYYWGRSGYKQISAADRALIHSILQGEEIGLSELVKLENEKKFLLTEFIENEPNFAISDFDRYRTLLFMQKAAHANDSAMWKLQRDSMRCHSSNIRNYLLMTLMLQHFYRDSEDEAKKNQTLRSLRDDIKSTLRELPSWYINPFCRNFHFNYNPLKNLILF